MTKTLSQGLKVLITLGIWHDGCRRHIVQELLYILWGHPGIKLELKAIWPVLQEPMYNHTKDQIQGSM